MADDSWPLAEAKAKLSEVVERALHHGPQHISRNGKKSVVVLSEDAYAKLTNGGGGLSAMFRDPRFRILTDEEHDELFVRSRDRSLPRPFKFEE
jgi:antitoxin Phd